MPKFKDKIKSEDVVHDTICFHIVVDFDEMGLKTGREGTLAVAFVFVPLISSPFDFDGPLLQQRWIILQQQM